MVERASWHALYPGCQGKPARLLARSSASADCDDGFVPEGSELTLSLRDLDDPAKTLTLSYAPLERGGFGTLFVDVRAPDLTCRAGFLTLEGDRLDAFLVAAAASSPFPRPSWMTLIGGMKLSVWDAGSDGVELRLELSPDQSPGYWIVEMGMRVSAESLGGLAPEVRRLFSQPAGVHPPPTLEAAVQPVTAEEAAALAEEAERLGWPVFVIDGPGTTPQFWHKVVSTLPLEPPIMSGGGLVWDALSDSMFGGMDELAAGNVVIWWKDSRHLARRDGEAYATAMSVFTQVVETLREPKYTDGDPTAVTVLVTA